RGTQAGRLARGPGPPWAPPLSPPRGGGGPPAPGPRAFVDQPPADQRQGLVGVVEQLAHRQRPLQSGEAAGRLPKYGDLTSSRLGDRPVTPPQVAPGVVEGRVVADGELGGRLLVQIDAQAGLVAAEEVAVLDLGAA